MWKTVTDRYHGNSLVYFEPMNEPHGYSQSQWADIAAQWISTYSSTPRNRIFVSGTGYNDHVTSVCADSRSRPYGTTPSSKFTAPSYSSMFFHTAPAPTGQSHAFFFI